MSKDLPLLVAAAPERRDAARNRRALLDAAAELMGGCGVEALTMDAVAAKAGVGKGTVFRRFGSREGLMASLLNHREEEWQAGVISGPPPLGPGACPDGPAAGLRRLPAPPPPRPGRAHRGGRPDVGRELRRAPGFASMHVRLLLGQLGVEGNLHYLATALIAPLGVPVLRQQIEHGGMSEEQVFAGWSELVRRVVEGQGT